MGSIITLDIENLQIDWAKNDYIDHSPLFLPTDVTVLPYYYADNVIEMREGLARPLGSVKNRLDLLGYHPRVLARRYAEQLATISDTYSEVPLSFDQLVCTLSSIDLGKASLAHNLADRHLGTFIGRSVIEDLKVRTTLPPGITLDRDLERFFEYLDPYITLRLLAENPMNANRMLQWRYADVVDGGWVDREEIVKPLDYSLRVLVVTEGSSDSFILERAMTILRPDIANFFYFVDMEEHYPFTGTGNLFRFCQGLLRIRIQNNVLVVFDNDAAGVEKFEQLSQLSDVEKILFCKLPNHDAFTRFRTIGPNGSSHEDINGAAVAIECFLDLSTMDESERQIRWTAFNRALQKYQGELEGKENAVRAFKKADLTVGSYDTSKLEFLLDYLVDQWIGKIASQVSGG
jgi:hypothetical protein